MAWWQGALLIIYSCALGLLMLLSLHRYILIRLYYRNKGKLPIPVGEFGDLPRVTIQLPVYNEVYVVERLIRAAAAIDYPNELLEIQVLDDSTDETTEVAQRCVTELRASGIDIVHIHRRDRTGFKAGALEAGLKVASGAYVALFDADFVPPRDFLNRTLPHFTDGSVGMVQVRWGHLNRDYSMLTRVQAILLDGHFVIEHGARSRSGMFFNFNGTAGVWRRTCIADAGGWQHDTLTEDLDLSYRAQLRGWRFVFLEDVVSPAEIPVEMNAWKSQQFRWAKGSIQAARKLLARVLTGRMPWRVKLEATVQLSSNLVYIFMALVALLIYPAVLSRQTFGWQRIFIVDLPLFLAATGVVSRFYIHSQKELYADWVGRLKYIPLVLALGMGISLNNAKAVLEALDKAETKTGKRVIYYLSITDEPRRIFDKAARAVELGARGLLICYSAGLPVLRQIAEDPAINVPILFHGSHMIAATPTIAWPVFAKLARLCGA
ncbi:MAG: glycosyltransferase, partial [Candidatus Latescibacteria bacterium]|nr:glycosyltransferase [Candidatus Latescibacterota bacterium]